MGTAVCTADTISTIQTLDIRHYPAIQGYNYNIMHCVQ